MLFYFQYSWSTCLLVQQTSSSALSPPSDALVIQSSISHGQHFPWHQPTWNMSTMLTPSSLMPMTSSISSQTMISCLSGTPSPWLRNSKLLGRRSAGCHSTRCIVLLWMVCSERLGSTIPSSMKNLSMFFLSVSNTCFDFLVQSLC